MREHFLMVQGISPAAEFEAAQASCSLHFAFAAAVPPPKDEKFCEAKLREPPLPHGSATRPEMPGRNSKLASLGFSFGRYAPQEEKGNSALGGRLRGWTAAGATAPAPYSFMMMENA